MFLVAVKTALVESLRSVWYQGGSDGQEAHTYNPQLTLNDKPLPRRITVEYPEEAHDWPFILVQVRPSIVEWTGIMPDEVVDAANYGTATDYSTTVDPSPPEAPQYKLIRQGRFEASCMLQIMALSSEERDRIWDNLVKLVMMGRKRSATNNFYTTLENHDLVGLTIMEGSIDAVGDTISMGTPWDPELLSYEASIQFNMVGTFFADEYTEDLVPLSAARVYEYIAYDGEAESSWRSGNDPSGEVGVPPFDSDGKGAWEDPWSSG